MNDVYIVSSVRTPIGKFGGALKEFSASDLGSIAIKSSINKIVINQKDIDMIILGNVLRTGHGQNIARQSAKKAGIPEEVDGYCLDMVCSSGMMSIINGSQMIKSNDANLIISGGIESMSQAAFSVNHDIRWGIKMQFAKEHNLNDTIISDGLTDPFNLKLMGEEADMIAKKYNINRNELDTVAYESHKRASEAINKDYFSDEIVPIKARNPNQKIKEMIEIKNDEGIRNNTSLEKLSTLKTVFSENGLHTAGNSSQLSDGAASIVLAGEKFVKENNLKPIAKILGYSWKGIESWRFTEAPVIAIKNLLKKINKNIDDIDYFENNEAFAVNSVILNKELDIQYNKLNVFGGAIAMGHPIGASGARLLVTLINVLNKKKAKTGIASLCHGTGGATAIALELL